MTRILLSLLGILSVVLLPVASYGGLVAYYDFEDGAGTTATDRTANSNHGTLTTMDPLTDWGTGSPSCCGSQ